MGQLQLSCDNANVCSHAVSLCKSDSKGACRLRIIAINDVYKLDNMARLKTLVGQESIGFPEHNVVTTLAGDFLGPSLLSALDGGCGMIRVLNQIPMDFVCFGNHETDIPYPKLVHRIAEFHGTWMNGNMPSFEPSLPSSCVLELAGDNGRPCARTVGFTGLCIGGGKFKNCYRDGAFGGAAAMMVPVVDAAKDVWGQLHAAHPDMDDVIPLTHQDMAEDVELAETGLFPVIVGGHDHEVISEVVGPRNSPVVKAGMDATNAAVIDLVWPEHWAAKAQVTVAIKSVSDYEADVDLAAKIDLINQPCRELETAMLYELRADESLTSVGVKFHESSMARKVVTAIRNCLECDAATINSGAVRGNKKYTKSISYGDLQKECPYPSVMLVVPMPFHVIRDAIRWSRKPWWESPDQAPKEGTAALQVDEGMDVDESHWLRRICGAEPASDPTKLYTVACDSRVLKKNPVFNEYCATFPDLIPPEDAGRPVLPILVEFFCGQLWERLLDSAAENTSTQHTTASKLRVIFDILDADHNGLIDEAELTAAIANRLGEQLSSKFIVQQMISMIDKNADGEISEPELRLGVMKLLNHYVSPELEQEFGTSQVQCVNQTKAAGQSRLSIRTAGSNPSGLSKAKDLDVLGFRGPWPEDLVADGELGKGESSLYVFARPSTRAPP